jgi:hypothetical protein
MGGFIIGVFVGGMLGYGTACVIVANRNAESNQQ